MLIHKKQGVLRDAILTLLRSYQRFIAPLLPGKCCRFYPSCSVYAVFCFEYLSFFHAVFLVLFRILRCNPCSKGYFDYPPGYPLEETK